MSIWLRLSDIMGPPSNNGWFKVLSYGRGDPNPGASTDKRPSRVRNSMSFMVPGDSNSAEIYEAFVANRVIKEVTLSQSSLMKYRMKDCLILSIKSDPAPPTLSFTIDFDSIEATYSGKP